MAIPDIPNAHALALILFTREKIPLESSSLFILVALMWAGLRTPRILQLQE